MSNEQVLKILKENIGLPVSGAEISRRLGVSRMTVSNDVRSLRQKGYEIASATKRGYILNSCADRLGFGDLSPLLPERPGELICLTEVDSTNTYLKNLAAEGAPHGTVVIADEQTCGRGRLGRSFDSPGGVGIYLSMLLRPDCSPDRALSITAGAAVAVHDTLEKVVGCHCAIKWMNDIILNGKKICGILTEMGIEAETNTVQYIVVGVGLNVNNPIESFSPELNGIAGSIYSTTGKKYDRCALASSLIRQLDEMYSNWLRDENWCFESYCQHCINLGKVAVIKQTGESVKVLRINKDFSLSVQSENGAVKTISSGEVSLRTEDGNYI